MTEIRCKLCNVKLTLKTLRGLRDVDDDLEGLYCPKCYPYAQKQLEKERFVEEYKYHKIYCKNGRYYPYWGCPYYFLSLKDVRRRIDDGETGIIMR